MYALLLLPVSLAINFPQIKPLPLVGIVTWTRNPKAQVIRTNNLAELGKGEKNPLELSAYETDYIQANVKQEYLQKEFDNVKSFFMDTMESLGGFNQKDVDGMTGSLNIDKRSLDMPTLGKNTKKILYTAEVAAAEAERKELLASLPPPFLAIRVNDNDSPLEMSIENFNSDGTPYDPDPNKEPDVFKKYQVDDDFRQGEMFENAKLENELNVWKTFKLDDIEEEKAAVREAELSGQIGRSLDDLKREKQTKKENQKAKTKAKTGADTAVEAKGDDKETNNKDEKQNSSVKKDSSKKKENENEKNSMKNKKNLKGNNKTK